MPKRILQGFFGVLQVNGYAGYNRLIAPDLVGANIGLAYCWAHARRKLVEITRNGTAPIAEDGVNAANVYSPTRRRCWHLFLVPGYRASS
jgi:hypothetical protein